MKLVITSDTHGYFPEVPPGDVLIHCGDATARGTQTQQKEFVQWLSTQPHKTKLFVSGNHCLFNESCYIDKVEGLIEDGSSFNTFYLRDNEIQVGGISFYGTPWTPKFGDWAFMYKTSKEGHEHYSKIPEGVDVLICHGPPYGILDTCLNRGTGKYHHVGSKELAYHINRVKPRLVVFGHIHHSYGTLVKDGITYINAACCTEEYEPLNPPVTIDI